MYQVRPTVDYWSTCKYIYFAVLENTSYLLNNHPGYNTWCQAPACNTCTIVRKWSRTKQGNCRWTGWSAKKNPNIGRCCTKSTFCISPVSQSPARPPGGGCHGIVYLAQPLRRGECPIGYSNTFSVSRKGPNQNALVAADNLRVTEVTHSNSSNSSNSTSSRGT